jgi:hypothetical protein
MNRAGKKLDVERIDDKHVRVTIREGDKIVSVVLKIVTERAAEIIESERERKKHISARTEEPAVA